MREEQIQEAPVRLYNGWIMSIKRYISAPEK